MAEQKFIQTPRIGSVMISVAHNSRTGGPGTEMVIKGGPNGSKIDEIIVQGLQATTAGVIRLYYEPETGGPTLLAEIPVKAVAATTETPPFTAALSSAPGDPGFAQALPFLLPKNAKILAGTQKAEFFTVTAFGGDF